jgi:DNA-binding beta-propeller fold protein YncE
MDRRAFLGLGFAGLPALLAGGRVAALARPPEDDPHPTGHRALALVTADAEAHVVAVSLADGRIVARLRTPPGPRSIESGPGGHAVVAHTGEGLLSLLDTSGRRPRLRRVLRGVAVPRYTAMAPDGRTAYVTDSERGELVVLDLERGRVAGRAEVGDHARHLTLDPAGRTLWVALGSKAPAIAVVDLADPRRPRMRRRIDPPFLAHDVGFAPSGRRVWVTSGDRRRLAVYAAGASGVGGPVVILPADAPPQHVAFAAGRAFVASGDSASVRVHDLASGRVVRTVAVPHGSFNVQHGAGRILTPSLALGTLTVLDARGRPRARRRIARAAHDACVA